MQDVGNIIVRLLDNESCLRENLEAEREEFGKRIAVGSIKRGVNEWQQAEVKPVYFILFC